MGQPGERHQVPRWGQPPSSRQSLVPLTRGRKFQAGASPLSAQHILLLLRVFNGDLRADRHQPHSQSLIQVSTVIHRAVSWAVTLTWVICLCHLTEALRLPQEEVLSKLYFTDKAPKVWGGRVQGTHPKCPWLASGQVLHAQDSVTLYLSRASHQPEVWAPLLLLHQQRGRS